MTAASTEPCSIAATAVAREADADHADGVRIDAVLAQQIFQEEVGRGAGRADADLLVR